MKILMKRGSLKTGVLFLAVIFLLASGSVDVAAVEKVFIARANAAYRAGRLPHAISLYKKAVSAGENSALACYNLANCYYRMKKPWLSIIYYRRVIRAAPSFAPAYLNCAKLYYEMKDYQAALELLDGLLKKYPENHEGYLLKGGCYLKLDALPEAILALEKAKNLKRENPATWLLMAEAWISLKDYDAAARILEEGALSVDGSEAILSLLAQVEVIRGKHESAVFHYLNCANLDKKNGHYLRRAAECYGNARRWFLAVDLLQEAVRREPGNVENYRFLARVYRRLELTAEAERVILRGASLDAAKMRGEVKALSILYFNRREYRAADDFRRRLRAVNKSLASLVHVKRNFSR